MTSAPFLTNPVTVKSYSHSSSIKGKRAHQGGPRLVQLQLLTNGGNARMLKLCLRSQWSGFLCPTWLCFPRLSHGQYLVQFRTADSTACRAAMGWLSARGWLWGAHLDISPELNWDSAPLAFSYRRRREIATCTAQQNCEYLFLFSPRKAYLLKTSKCCVPETSYKMNKYLKCYSNSEIFLARKRGGEK